MGVYDVVAAGADQPGQPGQRAQVAVAAHPEVGDPDAVGGQARGDRPGVGQGHHVALCGKVTQQQAQLLFRSTDAEPGDDVQGPHAAPTSRP